MADKVESIFDYDHDGTSYSGYRVADPRIAKLIGDALGHCITVLNVGAGTGSYEPLDRDIIALEPSSTMSKQRRGKQGAGIIRAVAEALPFREKSFEGAMAIYTVHHWSNLAHGLREVRRVTNGPIVIMTLDPFAPTKFWIYDYCPEMAEVARSRFGKLENLMKILGGTSEVRSIAVPIDCTDLFQEALYARPEMFLNPEIRKSQSDWKFLPPGVEKRVVESIASDLKSGEWDLKYGHLRSEPFLNCQIRLVVANP